MNGYVVTRPFEDSNVGSNLSSLAGAAWVARRLGRELIVDWRGMRQLVDPSVNYASEFFVMPAQLLGVPVKMAPVDGAQYTEGEPRARWLQPAEAQELADAGESPLPPYVVLQTYHGLDRVHRGPESERFRLLRECFRDIRPAPRIATAIDEWRRRELDCAFVVGVNVRTGNGAYFHKGMRYADRVDISLFADDRRFLDLLERAVHSRLRALPRQLRESFGVFYATDSAEMSGLLATLPNAVTRRRRFPPPGRGDLYAFTDSSYGDRDAIDDTVADMFLLAECDALVYNTSLFNQFARVVTGYYGGNCVHFESRLLRKRIQVVVNGMRRRLSWQMTRR